MAAATRDQVADYFIRFAHEVGDPITNLKLQKPISEESMRRFYSARLREPVGG